MDESPPRPLRSMFVWLVGASQLLGLASVVLTGVWMGHYRGGFAWDGSAQEFNLHPLCMVLGLVFLHGDAILVYRVFRNEAKRNVKLLHGIIHLLALIISIWVMGLLFFLFPVASAWLRASYLPIHVFCGLMLLVMAIGTSLLGITEKLLFNIMSSYSLFDQEGVLANILGIVLVCFGVLLGYLVSREEYRRPPNPEEESLSVHFKTLIEGGHPPGPDLRSHTSASS
ncbi:hypothetical protein INR49_006467 [Caranx melampygus]|nr:hypothetical protein INR49_006467 [Caranx melampygus]